CQQYDGLPVTF
nr:immunoglobulin light chain junction region [Macaca mulatta]